MTTPPQPLRARPKNRWLTLGAAALAFAMAASTIWGVACSSIESMNFSNGDCVAGGCAQSGASSSGSATSSGSTTSSSSSSSGAMVCQDAGCTVSWATDIYTGIFETNVGCTTNLLCHGTPASKGGLTLDTGAASAGYIALTSYVLASTPGPVKAYIVGCDTSSGILCNMIVDDGMGGVVTPYGTCGSPMPKNGVHKLSQDQLNTIADWIKCGALNN